MESLICTNLSAPLNNAGQHHCTHKCCPTQTPKTARRRRQDRNFKARAHMYYIPSHSSPAWHWGKDTGFVIHLSYCTVTCRKNATFWRNPNQSWCQGKELAPCVRTGWTKAQHPSRRRKENEKAGIADRPNATEECMMSKVVGWALGQVFWQRRWKDRKIRLTCDS